jgi:oxygen-independent coproporphyrinogen-3 oxidase
VNDGAGGGETSPRPPVALYVHVPFCLSLCPYCDFVVYTGSAARGPAARIAPFLRALATELELRADELDREFGTPGRVGRPALRSVYLGGGTPSLLGPDDVASLLERTVRRFGLAADAEVTIEANPGPGERGDMAGFRAAGVTRLSLGAQSLDPAELRRLGRRHRPGDVASALEEARRAGIEHRSIDLLYDIPGEGETVAATWRGTVQRVLELPIDHLSAYALTLDDPEAEGLAGPSGDHLPVRPGARRWRERARPGQDADRAADAYAWLDERAAEAGFAWYEISNWSRSGAESRHNLVYWQREPYLALGPGAHAFDGARRRSWNAARLDRYLAALDPADGAARLPPGGEERLDDRAATIEKAMLGLRLCAGLDPPLAGHAEVAPALVWAAAHGLAETGAGGRTRLTLRGRLLSSEVFARLG